MILKRALTDRSDSTKLFEMDKKRGARLFCAPRTEVIDKKSKVGFQTKIYSNQLNRKNEAI